MKYVLLLIQLVYFQVAIAQKIFNPGIVELSTGEKIEALILQDSYKNYARTITYKIPEEGVLHVKSPNEVRSFTIEKQNIKFHSFKIVDRFLIAPNVYDYKDETVFMKQLEEGKVNLFLHKDDEGNSWLYLKKGDGLLKRLEAIKKEYDAIDKSKMIRIDTVTSTKHIRGGFFKTEKPYLQVFSNVLGDCESIDINGSLELQRNLVMNMVSAYNNACGDPGKRYFKGQPEFRFHFLGGYFPADNLREIFIPSTNLEVEFLMNSLNNNISFSFGFFGSGKLKAKNNTLTSTDEDVKFRQFYLRSNFYASQRNRLKPYGFFGIKLAGYDQKRNNVAGLWKADGVFGLGGGLLYEFSEYGVARLELSNRPFPDIKLGIGLRLK